MIPATILLTDDDEGHTILIEENLRLGGLTNPVLVFPDGHALLDYLHGIHPRHHLDPHRPHLLLLDIRMPRLDGMEVLRRIKNDPRLKRLPVIMLTTTDDTREVNHAYDLGCAGYLTKPVDYTLFAAAMQQLGHFLSLLEIPRLGDTTAT